MKRARYAIQVASLISSNSRLLVLGGLLLVIASVQTVRSLPTKPAKIETTSNLATTIPGAEHVSAASTLATHPTDQPLPRALVTIRPTGFDPAEITISNGRFLLAFDNKSGLPSLALRLVREGGGREVRWSLAGRKLREKLTLPAGEYTLTESNHPNWLCRITVND